MKPLRVCLLGLVVAVGGCVVGPNYRPPPPLPASQGPFVSTAPGAAAPAALPPYWWRLYRDPLLDYLVQRALTENQDLKTAAANLAYAQALLDEARAGRYPTTSLSFGPSFGRSSSQLAANQPAGVNFAAAFVAAYQIDLFGQIRRTIESARANAEASAAAEDAVRVTVAAETAGAYAAACGYGAQIEVARRSLAVVQQTYDLTVFQRNAGALDDFDVDRQAVLLEQARAAIPPLEGQRRVALFTLAALIGETPAQFPAAVSGCVTPPTLSQPLPVGDGAALIRRRPDVRQAERNLAAETAKIGVAVSQLYPTITLGGSVASSSSTLGGLFSAKGVTYGVGANLPGVPPLISWSFPNIAIAQSHVREARAQASAALANFNGVVLTALKETEQALSTYATELDHRAALGRAQRSADAALALAQLQYKAGTASVLDLLQAQAAAVAAAQALSASEQQVSVDQVAVFQALGGGWEGAPAVAPPPIAGVTPKIR